jgi:hypothetical protein
MYKMLKNIICNLSGSVNIISEFYFIWILFIYNIYEFYFIWILFSYEQRWFNLFVDIQAQQDAPTHLWCDQFDYAVSRKKHQESVINEWWIRKVMRGHDFLDWAISMQLEDWGKSWESSFGVAVLWTGIWRQKILNIWPEKETVMCIKAVSPSCREELKKTT